jgi:hypothetical protein
MATVFAEIPSVAAACAPSRLGRSQRCATSTASWLSCSTWGSTGRTISWSAGPTSTCTPGPLASTGAATETSAATAHARCWSAPWPTGPYRRNSSTSPGPCPRSLTSPRWPEGLAAWRSTSTPVPSSTAGLTATGKHDGSDGRARHVPHQVSSRSHRGHSRTDRQACRPGLQHVALIAEITLIRKRSVECF